MTESPSVVRGTLPPAPSMPRNIRKYLRNHARDDRPFLSGDVTGIDQVVAVPALAEKDHLFAMLASLSRNPAADLQRTLVICVINNRGRHLVAPEIIDDNRQTLDMLKDLASGTPSPGSHADASLAGHLREITGSGLRVSCIDASSPGNEMPDRGGGVGMARKIAMDHALRVFDYGSPAVKLIFCLDADTRVEGNYLPAVRSILGGGGMKAAVVAYAHRDASDPLHRAAIRSYEIFLRYYVLGLAYARSPYAFHTVGSTMICTADAYAAVRGMNLREAAEDFYFLTKLAKVCEVGTITKTQVYPSARRSTRVPFGTGRQMVRFLEEGRREYLAYDPRVFRILKQWLAAVHARTDRDGNDLQRAADEIDPLLGSFLRSKGFGEAWDKIRGNCRDDITRGRQFSSWFDGFKTLKLIHRLTEGNFPRMNMFRAVEGLFAMMREERLDGSAPR